MAIENSILAGAVRTAADMLRAGMPSTQMFDNGSGLFVNHQVSITHDLVFGLSVWDGDVWVPLNELSADDLIVVSNAIRLGGGQFPWDDKFGALYAKAIS